MFRQVVIAGATALLMGSAAAMAQSTEQDQSRALEAADKLDIIETVNAIGTYADLGQWDRVLDQFAPEGVVLDYSSYATATAGTDADPEPQDPREIIAAWQTVLPGYDHTQHLIGNHQVEVSGDEATSVSTVYATHFLPNEEGENYWVFIGDYEHHLVRTSQGWKVDRMTANMRAQLGNENLSQLAIERVKQRAAQN